MHLVVHLGSDVPVYRQIMGGVRQALVAGELQPGDQLPTVRELAFELGVHHNTVARAYRELADEGWLELQRRNGAMVRQRTPPRASAEAKRNYLRRLRELAAEATAAGISPKALTEELQLGLAAATAAPSKRKP